MISLKRITFLFLLFSLCFSLKAQQRGATKPAAGVYVDDKGVLRWKDSKKEASFFGVNYTVPFAYGYRSHKVLGADLEAAIRQDVYHMARLGLDAFRVHVWDTEITDTLGNLIENEHLRLFDFLLSELKKRNIKIMITPIAFWGNGYPEPDEKTPGFSGKYGKDQSLVNEEAIRAQENYLTQFFKHVNPYTRLSYAADPDIIATEINNEPHHSGPRDLALRYINRMAAAIRGTGWRKPVFYNISESPYYATSVARSDIDGVSFQWYPTGLVANHELKGNYLPHVSKYSIPFDTIPAFAGQARMVYEFDAGDVLQPVMYPAMARSFRTAGFQWATQFAYDPLATAYANTEYQTHYLNLAYTPSKAISLLIASRAFHEVPRLKSYGTYPQNSSFGVFRTDYLQQLSEMNSPEELYYSNSTNSQPPAVSRLKKIAGVGSSAVVRYEGKGAYFLDKLAKGVWRLEVMPDAISVRDPFEKASLKKEVTRIEWKDHRMTILLPDLSRGFTVKGLNKGNNRDTVVKGDSFHVSPGTYLITAPGSAVKGLKMPGVLLLDEFVAPPPSKPGLFLRHEPLSEVSAGREFEVSAVIAGISPGAKVSLQLNQLGWQNKVLAMQPKASNVYAVSIPADFVKSGVIQYRIIVQQGERYHVFPGNHEGNPFAWDNYTFDTWKTYVASAESPIELFNAANDRDLIVFPQWDKNVETAFTGTAEPGRLAWSITASQWPQEGVLAFQCFAGHKLEGRKAELPAVKSLLLKARSNNGANERLKITLIDSEGASFSAYAVLKTTMHEAEILLSDFKPEASLLLPRPYPGFGELRYTSRGTGTPDASRTEKIQVSLEPQIKDAAPGQIYGAEIQSIYFKK